MGKEINLKCEHNHHIFHPLCDQLSFSGKCMHVAGAVALVVFGIFSVVGIPFVIYGVYNAFFKKSSEQESAKPTHILNRVDFDQTKNPPPQDNSPQNPAPQKGKEVGNSPQNPAPQTVEQENKADKNEESSFRYAKIAQADQKKIEDAIAKANLPPAHYFVLYCSNTRIADVGAKKGFAAFCEEHKKDKLPVCFVVATSVDSLKRLKELKESTKEGYLNIDVPNCSPEPLILAVDGSGYKVREVRDDI